MAKTRRKKHRCRGMTKKSHYKERCPRKINPDKYKQGIRCCKRHIDQEVENDEASSSDGESEEDDTVSSGKDEEDSAVSSGESATTPQTHPAPFIYIGNSKQYTDNPQITHRPQTHSSSTREPQQREQAQYIEPQQNSFISRVGHDHASSSGRHSVRDYGHGHTERQEAPNTQRTAQDKRSYNSPPNPLVESHGSFAEQVPQDAGQFKQSSRPSRSSGSHEMQRVKSEFADQRAAQGQHHQSYSEPSSQYKQNSEPLHQSGSHITKPFGQHKSSSESPSAPSSARRDSSAFHGRSRQADFTYGRWKAASPSEALTSSDRARPSPPPQFDQPQVPPTNFINATPPPSVYASRIRTQSRPTQRERRPPPSQDQAPDRASWSHSAPAPQSGPPTGHFSINLPSHGAPIPGSPKKTVAVSIDGRSPTEELDGNKGRRQTRVSAAQIQQQYAIVCEHWQHFSTGVEKLLDMLQPE